jgi:hypothetical protein
MVGKLSGTIPVDLVLSIIYQESRGTPGAIGRGATRGAILERDDGSTVDANHALGLMQVIPPNISEGVTYEDMTGKDLTSTSIQISEGLIVLRSAFRSLNRINSERFPFPHGPLSEEQTLLGVAAYLYGIGRVRKALDTLRADGRPQTWRAIKSRWPQWGEPKNKPIRYVTQVMARLGNKNRILNKTGSPIFLIGLLAIAFFAMKGK